MSAQWMEKEAAHLLSRATFFPGRQEVNAAVQLGKDETVRRLVAGESLTGRTFSPEPIERITADGKALDQEQIADQQTYWLYRMIYTQAPLIEKMTLFWHGHFTTSYQKVREMPLIVRQNGLLRSHALGSFRDLVREIGKDPAMIVYLDTNNSRKGKPNENYAREAMELFTLGIGNYTEEDVKEAARALTGWSYDKKTDQVSFNAKQHDDGTKTVLGHTGPLDADGFVEVLFEQQALPRWVARKLLTWFAAAEPSDEWVNGVAAVFAKSFHIGDTLRSLFLSDAFYAPELRGSLVKSPVEYVAGIAKALELPVARGYAQALRKMGQELYLPPNVAGWRGGTAWLTTANLLARCQFAESAVKRLNQGHFSAKDYMLEASASPQQWVKQFGLNVGVRELGEQTSAVLANYADETFIHAVQKTNGMRGLLQLVLISPEAQMK
ncbi:DUF1800 domain-containing protein [Paenibacillus tyrfis]|uniref:DUF1800 domain-containing protein n=1 Tax=Paenibacillus tyrfis TaxID=1501230 RepID=UPI000B58FFA3|nr:DUF1800 domain-containing protein [Paenibacillus tyrfis]